MKTSVRLICTVVLLNLSLFCKAQVSAFLDINQVKALIHSSGSLFWDTTFSAIHYEVPKGSGLQTIFASNLWVGGIDAGNNLRLAAQTYRQPGTDFWPGPLDTTTATISPATMAQWNRVWKIDKTTIDSFRVGLFSSIPQAILDWPGNGDSLSAQGLLLAPFVDLNNNGKYEPVNGDYPCIKGDQAIYFIFNDKGGIHSETGCNSIGLEIHGMAYGFKSPVNSFLENTIFINFKIINRSPFNLHNTSIGNWTDFDLGNYSDDFIGCDVKRNAYYVLNGDAMDEFGYGAKPPAQAVVFLKGPVADPMDLIDNDHDSIIDEADESIGMSSFLYYNNDASLIGNPDSCFHFYNYLNYQWKDSSLMTYDGNGHNSGGALCRYMFPGDSDPNGFGITNGVPQIPWDEPTSGNVPGDRRGVASSGRFTLQAGMIQCIDFAYVYSREDTVSSYYHSLPELKEDIDSVQAFYDASPELQTCVCSNTIIGIDDKNESIFDFSISPNPSYGKFQILFNVKKPERLALQLVNILGELVYSSKVNAVAGYNQYEIPTQSFSKGIYLLKIYDGTSMLIRKVVIDN